MQTPNFTPDDIELEKHNVPQWENLALHVVAELKRLSQNVHDVKDAIDEVNDSLNNHKVEITKEIARIDKEVTGVKTKITTIASIISGVVGMIVAAIPAAGEYLKRLFQ